MTNNDILRRLRYALNFTDEKMVSLFDLGGLTVPENDIDRLMMDVEDDVAIILEDFELGSFLDGLIVERRGARDGEVIPPPKQLSNNAVLKKIRIALTMHEGEMLETFKVGGHPMSRGELTAIFRKKNHKHYRECGDQALRKFLRGLTARLRPEKQQP